MDQITQSLIGVCIVLVGVRIIVLILYFQITTNTYKKQAKKRTEVDYEIENELKKNTK